MTKDKNFKRVVRNEMADSGERYTAVRDRLGDEAPRPAHRRIVGLETRYSALSIEGERPSADIAESVFRRVRGWGRSSNVFLQNGARLYIVGEGVMEYATPECDSARQVVAHTVAGDAILSALAQRAEPSGVRILHDNGPNGGGHENYAIGSIDVLLLRTVLLPFLVARQLYTGGGAVLTSPRGFMFVLSQRAEHVSKGNDLAVVAAETPRLHVACGDVNRAEVAMWMKVATTSLVLRMLEERPALLNPDDCALANPVRALRQSAHDVTGKLPLDLASGESISTLSLLTHYLEAATRFVSDAEVTSEERAAVGAWRETIQLLEAKDHAALAQRCDWAAKLVAMPHPLGPGGGLVDAAYDQVSPAPTPVELERVATDSEIEDCGPPKYLAPQTTRAKQRSEFIKKGIETRRDYTVDWIHLKLNDQAQRTIRLQDPYVSDDPRVEALIAAMDEPPPS